MTVEKLIEELEGLMEKDPYVAEAEVTFGRTMEPVSGGIMTRNLRTGLAVLNLAPVQLDRIGGF